MTQIGWGKDVSADPHVAYTIPSGLLPFGISASVGYAPNTTNGQSNSFKSTGGAQTADADMVPGLSLGADYYEVGNSTSALGQEETSGNYYVKYEVGNFKLGIMDGYFENGVADKYASASA